MWEKVFLGRLFPAHSDLQPLLKQIREKYDLPNRDDPDKNLAGIIDLEKEIPWEQIRGEIKLKINNHPDLFSDQTQQLRNLANNSEVLENPMALVEEWEITEDVMRQVVQGMIHLVKPLVQAYNQIVEDITNLLFYYLVTGDTKEIPTGWQGAVYTMPFLGEQVVVAMASQLSNPNEIRDKFVAEMHKQFGTDRPKVTKGMLNFASYLRQRMSGVGLAKIVDAYIEDHPDQFNKDRDSVDFRDQRYREIERMKKALGRYEEKLSKLIGDKN